MRSSAGNYYQALDHVRAVAVFLVFAWHFNRFGGGQFDTSAIPGMALFTEGHTGVSIFMTLSGYLFARLIGDRDISYPAFLWNRFIRLAPMLVVVFILVGVERALQGQPLDGYMASIARGFVLPEWPNGGWSLAVEIHFYLVLPALLAVARVRAAYILGFVVVSLLLRAGIWYAQGTVQHLAYFTLLGRIDQFVLGIFAYRIGQGLMPGWKAALGTFLAFTAFWFAFDQAGGFFGAGDDNSPSPVWIFLPTIEAAAYAVLIRWYDNAWRDSEGVLAKGIALVGTYSYSIYLLHIFVVFRLPVAIDRYVVPLDDGMVRALFVIPCFLVMLPIAWLSWRLIEEPCLRLRKQYIRGQGTLSRS